MPNNEYGAPVSREDVVKFRDKLKSMQVGESFVADPLVPSIPERVTLTMLEKKDSEWNLQMIYCGIEVAKMRVFEKDEELITVVTL